MVSYLSLAIILTFIIIEQIPKLVETVFGVFKIFTGAFDSYQLGIVLGATNYWRIHIALTITLWIYGRRWIKHKNVV